MTKQFVVEKTRIGKNFMGSSRTFFLPYNVPSLKNSKVVTPRGVFPSKTVRKYLQKLGIKKYSGSRRTVGTYKPKIRPNIFDIKLRDIRNIKTYPLIFGFHFVRETRHKFDFNNAIHIISDLLVAHRFIPDDSMDYFLPTPFMVDGKWYSYDKKRSGVFIVVTDDIMEIVRMWTKPPRTEMR